MTPLQYKQFIVDTYQANKKVIDKAAVSKACKTYARVQLDINYIDHLLGYKTYLSMSNMISKDSTAQKNLETPIDSASYFKGLSKMSILAQSISVTIPITANWTISLSAYTLSMTS